MGRKSKPTSEYWKDRFEKLEKQRHKDDEIEVGESITPAFDGAMRQIESEISTWYQRYAENNGIDMATARKQLNAKELKEFKWDVQQYIAAGKENAVDQRWMKELENASARFHINRLESLRVRVQNAAETAFGNEEDKLTAYITKQYGSDYYHTAYEIQKGFGIGFEVGTIDQTKLNKLLEKPWTADGATFSDRIWKSKRQLISSVDTELTQMCLLGRSPDEAIKNISDRMNVSKAQAGRLVMTESAYFAEQAQKQCFEDLDVEEFEVVSTLDDRTSPICQEMDGKHFPMTDWETGVNAPPFHPNCRTTTVPYFDDEFTVDEFRASKLPDDGGDMMVSGMNYADWKKAFVEGDDSEIEDIVDPDTGELIGVRKKRPQVEVPAEAENIPVASIDTLTENRKNLREEIISRQAEISEIGKHIGESKNYIIEYDDLKARDTEGFMDLDTKQFNAKKKELKESILNLNDEETDLIHEMRKIKEPWEDVSSLSEENQKKWKELHERKMAVVAETRQKEKQLEFTKEITAFNKKYKDRDYAASKASIDKLSKEQREKKKTLEGLYDQLDDVESQIGVLNGGTGKTYRQTVKEVKQRIADNGGVITDADIHEVGAALEDEIKNSDHELEKEKLRKEAEETLKIESAERKKYDDAVSKLDERSKAYIYDYDRLKDIVDNYESRGRDPGEMYRSRLEHARQMYEKYVDQSVRDQHDRYVKAKQDAANAYKNVKHIDFKDSEENVKFVLSKVREMGVSDFDIESHFKGGAGSSNDATQMVKEAYDYYPTEWVEKSLNKGKLQARLVSRGYYMPTSYGDTEIAISVHSANGAKGTCIHELGHRMEDSFPEIKKLEASFYARRTAGESLKWMGAGYGRSEVTRRDNFINAYMGKDYGGTAYELVSMGFQYAYTEPETLMKDPDMCEWIYGMLSLL